HLRLSRRSTLFPYTTLFRSDEHEASGLETRARALNQKLDRPLVSRAPRKAVTRTLLALDGQHVLMRSCGWCSAGLPPSRSRSSLDRKSTRLNSSHRTISYAV